MASSKQGEPVSGALDELGGLGIRFRFNGCEMAAVRLDAWVNLADTELPVGLSRDHVAGRLRCRGDVYIILSSWPLETALNERPIAQVLTQRELKIACMIAEGLTDKEIGRKLGISAYTVREHCRRACAKLSISRRSALVKRIFDCGLSPNAPYRKEYRDQGLV